jgi:hypothetical protein
VRVDVFDVNNGGKELTKLRQTRENLKYHNACLFHLPVQLFFGRRRAQPRVLHSNGMKLFAHIGGPLDRSRHLSLTNYH